MSWAQKYLFEVTSTNAQSHSLWTNILIGMLVSLSVASGPKHITSSIYSALGSDSRTVSEYFKLKVTFKVAILKSGLHQHLNLTHCFVVYIALMLCLKTGVE